jgi:hypothetical protein
MACIDDEDWRATFHVRGSAVEKRCRRHFRVVTESANLCTMAPVPVQLNTSVTIITRGRVRSLHSSAPHTIPPDNFPWLLILGQ